MRASTSLPTDGEYPSQYLIVYYILARCIYIYLYLPIDVYSFNQVELHSLAYHCPYMFRKSSNLFNV